MAPLPQCWLAETSWLDICSYTDLLFLPDQRTPFSLAALPNGFFALYVSCAVSLAMRLVAHSSPKFQLHSIYASAAHSNVCNLWAWPGDGPLQLSRSPVCQDKVRTMLWCHLLLITTFSSNLPSSFNLEMAGVCSSGVVCVLGIWGRGWVRTESLNGTSCSPYLQIPLNCSYDRHFCCFHVSARFWATFRSPQRLLLVWAQKRLLLGTMDLMKCRRWNQGSSACKVSALPVSIIFLFL